MAGKYLSESQIECRVRRTMDATKMWEVYTRSRPKRIRRSHNRTTAYTYTHKSNTRAHTHTHTIETCAIFHNKNGNENRRGHPRDSTHNNNNNNVRKNINKFRDTTHRQKSFLFRYLAALLCGAESARLSVLCRGFRRQRYLLAKHVCLMCSIPVQFMLSLSIVYPRI